ncbi:putative signal peptide protein [Puccinia sorghi]|uniref:Putative signal peptide protein n=1 Tax=Puccinia sorghi TaxID=27349 RepID=A0A0L6VF81_9BASI|nr:putative signal peptide protein [Puccinia sorghi]
MHFPACHSFPLSLVPLLFTPRSIAAPTYQVESIGKSVLDGSTQLRHALPEDSFSYERVRRLRKPRLETVLILLLKKVPLPFLSLVICLFLLNKAPHRHHFNLESEGAVPNWKHLVRASKPRPRFFLLCILPQKPWMNHIARMKKKPWMNYIARMKKVSYKIPILIPFHQYIINHGGFKDIFRVKAYSQFKLDNQDQKRMEAHMEQFLSRLPEFNEITPKLEQIVTTWKKRLIEVEPSSTPLFAARFPTPSPPTWKHTYCLSSPSDSMMFAISSRRFRSGQTKKRTNTCSQHSLSLSSPIKLFSLLLPILLPFLVRCLFGPLRYIYIYIHICADSFIKVAKKKKEKKNQYTRDELLKPGFILTISHTSRVNPRNYRRHNCGEYFKKLSYLISASDPNKVYFQRMIKRNKKKKNALNISDNIDV